METMKLRYPPDFPEDVGVLKKGPWAFTEDAILVAYVIKHGEGNWNSVPKQSGLLRCGKSCRLRWANHLRPNLKKGAFTPEEKQMIIELHAKLGNKWAQMAAQLPGRTDNAIKNYWNTRINRRMRACRSIYPPEMQTLANNSQCNMFEHGEIQSVSSGGESESCDPGSDSPTNDFQNLNVSALHGGIVRPGCHMKSCSSLTGMIGDMPLSSVVTHTLSGGQSISSPVRRVNQMQRDSQCSSISGGSGSAVMFPQLSDESSNTIPYFKARRSCETRNSMRLAQLGGCPDDPDPENLNFEGITADGYLGLPYTCSRPNSSLKLELPSSQSAESEDSAGTPGSAMTSPYTSFSLSSEVHSFGSNNNSFLEALLQKAQTLDHTGSHEQVRSSELSDQLLVLPSSNPLMEVVSLMSPRKTKWGEDSDPISQLEGRPYPMFSEDTSPNCSSNWDETSTLQSPLTTISSALHSPHHHGIKIEQHLKTGPERPCGNYTDEEISTSLDFARPDAAPVTVLYKPAEIYIIGGKPGAYLPEAIEAAFHHQDVAAELKHLGEGEHPPRHPQVTSCMGARLLPVEQHAWRMPYRRSFDRLQATNFSCRPDR